MHILSGSSSTTTSPRAEHSKVNAQPRSPLPQDPLPPHVRGPSAGRRARNIGTATNCDSASDTWSAGTPHIFVSRKVREQSGARRVRFTPTRTDYESAIQACSNTVAPHTYSCTQLSASRTQQGHPDVFDCESRQLPKLIKERFRPQASGSDLSFQIDTETTFAF